MMNFPTFRGGVSEPTANDLTGDSMHNEILRTIHETIASYKASVQYGLWKKPVIEIISAEDQKLQLLKEAVSAEHFMPRDILPEAKSIVSFFIPFHDDVVKSNIGGTMASETWAMAYIKTNDVIRAINDAVETLMENHGHKTGKIPATHNFDEEKLISNWSHRHIAYIAGMGTFGMNNMLITKNGCCGRFGSIVTTCEFDSYKGIETAQERCLHKTGGSCGICQKNCVVGAYGNNNFDRHKCYKQCLENAKHHKNIGYADICGKCLVGLPCSTKDPRRIA
jgi:epoxyqueuosine reductase QueG